MLLIGLPIMGGGMGAGAVPMSKIFESFDYQGAINVKTLTPNLAHYIKKNKIYCEGYMDSYKY